MNKILTFLFIILSIAGKNVFAAAYQQDSNIAISDSFALKGSYFSTKDTASGESFSETMKSKLIEKEQVIPRNYQFKLNITSILRGLLGMFVLILIAFILSCSSSITGSRCRISVKTLSYRLIDSSLSF